MNVHLPTVFFNNENSQLLINCITFFELNSTEKIQNIGVLFLSSSVSSVAFTRKP